MDEFDVGYVVDCVEFHAIVVDDIDSVVSYGFDPFGDAKKSFIGLEFVE